MIDWPQLIAQVPDDDGGAGWKSLFYLAIFIVVPIINAIKDKFVKRAEEKQALAAEVIEDDADLPSPPVKTGLENKLPIAALLKPEAGATPRMDAPAATPARPARPTAPPRPSSPPPQARPLPSAAPTPGPRPAPGGRPQPRPAARRPQQASPTRRVVSGMDGVDVHAADPRVDVHLADPRVDMGRVDRSVPDAVHEAKSSTITSDDAPGAGVLPVGGSLVPEDLSPAAMRRAIVLSEILQPPLALRDPQA